MATAAAGIAGTPVPDKGVIIDPSDFTALAQFGASFWLDELQPLRAGQGLAPKVRRQFRDTVIMGVAIQ